MKTVLTHLVAVAVMAVLSVGGNMGCGAATDSPPDVAGDYTCISGCGGVCGFAETGSVTQDGSHIIIVDENGTCTGEIDNNGDYTTDCDCNGSFAGGVVTSDCADCPRVTYQRD